jgi:hypothetical protein
MAETTVPTGGRIPGTPSLKPSVDAVVGFFGVLVGIGLTHLLELKPAPSATAEGELGFFKWACFISSTATFFRFILGSANQLNWTYVEGGEWSAKRFVVDAMFLAVFGIFALLVCYSPCIAWFFIWHSVLLVVAVAWDWFLDPPSQAQELREAFSHWLTLDLIQAVATLAAGVTVSLLTSHACPLLEPMGKWMTAHPALMKETPPAARVVMWLWACVSVVFLVVDLRSQLKRHPEE